jgi:hypothetical protein
VVKQKAYGVQLRKMAMNKTYIVKRIDMQQKLDWEKAMVAHIDYYPWDRCGYCPQAQGKLLISQEALHVQLTAWEEQRRCEVKQYNGPVCEDSCLEFFFMPDPGHDKKYLSFEWNPLGYLFLSLGKDKCGREMIDIGDFKSFFHVKILSDDEIWGVEFAIPNSCIKTIFSLVNMDVTKMKGNFFKCGNKTKYPHYGCWNNIKNKIPDFHLSDFFGNLVIETENITQSKKIISI